MAYILNKSNGQQLTVLNDGLIDDALTSIFLVGKNVSNYGNKQNENFLYLLENFANASVVGGQPRSPVTGQLWFDTTPTISRPLVFDGATWRPLAISWYDTTTTNRLVNALSDPNFPFAVSKPGDFFVNSTTKQLFVITDNSATTSLIGPEMVPGYNTTRMVSTKMYDVNGQAYPVIQTILDGEVISVYSKTAFTQQVPNTVPGFTNIYRGQTLKNFSTATLYSTASTDVSFFGINNQLDRSFVRRNQIEHIQQSWIFDDDTYLNFGTQSGGNIYWSSLTNAVNISSLAAIKLNVGPSTITYDGNKFGVQPYSPVDLGAANLPWQFGYINTLTSFRISAQAVFDSGQRVLTAATLPASGVVVVQGTQNQVASTATNGVVTLSLTDTVSVNNFNANNVTATNIAGNVVTDNGSRVITVATLPYSISNVVGTDNQIAVNIVGSTATLSLPTNVAATNINANSISASDIYENGYRVLTAATLPTNGLVSIQGTPNQIATTSTNGAAIVSLPNTVSINSLTAATTNITNQLNASNANINSLSATNETVTTLNATNASVSQILNANSIGAASLAVSGNASVYGSLTASNITSAGSLFGINLTAAFGSISNQLNANNLSANTATFITFGDSFGTKINKIDKDPTFAANSDLNLATQKAIAAYVQSAIASFANNLVMTPPVPTGAVFFVAMQTPPSGYLIADGSSLSTTQYSNLFAAIGYTYGGSGSNFNLPDLRGQFIRGWDSSGLQDPGRVFGSSQLDDFKSHRHVDPFAENDGTLDLEFGQVPGTYGARGCGESDNDQSRYYTGYDGGTETRPKNIALLPIIKT